MDISQQKIDTLKTEPQINALNTEPKINTLKIEPPKSKTNFLPIILILSIIIILGLLAAVITLAILLHKKRDDYDELEQKYISLNKNNTLMNQTYSNQNDSLYDIFYVYQKLIQKTNISNNQISRDSYHNVKDMIRNSKVLPDGTYDLITNEEVTFDKGYQVSFETDYRNYENDYYTDKEYDELVYKLACIFGVNASLGVYETIPEISYYIEDKDTALAIAALYNQISIWDWKEDFEILNQFRQDKDY